MRGVVSLRQRLSSVCLVGALFCVRGAAAQTAEDLDTARRLFRDAVADEEAHRYDTALEKFRRVDHVKETANVRYRMATCLEALGRRAEALDSYERAARLGEEDKPSADAASASAARAAQLEPVVPRLSFQLPADPRPGLEVRVDDKKVDDSALKDPMPLDPGHHTVDASAPGYTPFHTGVTLAEGARVSISVALDPAAPSPPPAPVAPPPPAEPAPAASASPPVAGIVALGLGGVLTAGSILSFILRGSNVSSLEGCPQVGGAYQCPESDRGAYDAAKIEGPLGIGLAAGAALAVGLGVWLVVTPPTHAASSPSRAFVLGPAVAAGRGALLIAGWRR